MGELVKEEHWSTVAGVVGATSVVGVTGVVSATGVVGAAASRVSRVYAWRRHGYKTLRMVRW